ncbi:PP2C family protein-serine/threonine phosphatase [Azospirillum thermophilum]|uniref:Transcriptional regulator n=1 Tax=Azospirillum thermophilum TaxID=2202148 RepID=A0A2S2CSR1_9PROT|nr:SpoIIE family protein phosphatase [Azospirillum thermophilum]AWK87420.1 transcriptional regulator [Azospirillum thermophilum]
MTATGPSPASALLLDPAVADARILVVDDNRVNRNLLVALLERGGITRIDQAEDGTDGLARVESFKPDLILLDLMMPNVDGFEMCRRLRADPRWKTLPILVQSSLNRSEDRARAFAAGATDYVGKPLNASELLARVQILLRRKALVQDLEQFRRRAEAELDLARRMQERLMPAAGRLAEVERSHGVAIAAHFAPSSELGGDFWGLYPMGPGRLGVHLVDFSGHGVGAALNTFRLQVLCQQIAAGGPPGAGPDPADYLARINRRLCTLLPAGQFATMLVGVIDTRAGEFVYASAGSTRPMAWSLDGSAAGAGPLLGDSAGLPLGLLATAEYETRRLPLPAGGRLFLYSDAAIEIPAGDDVLDDVGLAALVSRRMAERDGARFLAGILDDLHAAGPIDDDLTALVLTRLD